MTPEQFYHLFRSMNHFDQDNGASFVIHGPGKIEYRMTVAAKHTSSPGVAHGAALAGLMDCVLGMTALSLALPDGNLVSTVEFKVNFIRPGKLGEELIGTGAIDYKGKSLIIASGSLHTSSGELVAKGLGTFNVYPMEKRLSGTAGSVS